MHRTQRGAWLAALIAAAVLSATAPPASAHVTRQVGAYTVTLGWGNEPPLAGFENFVEVGVTDGAGEPVTDLGSAPTVEISFGAAATVVPLLPSEEPGEFRATLVPTRPGTYAFRVNATVEGRDLTTGATCSERTFECVTAATEVEFPVKDPSVGEVAERITSAAPRADQAADDAKNARRLAVIAIALAAVALTTTLVTVHRGRRKSD